MKRNNGLLIAILAVGVLILVMLTLNFAKGGVWMVKGLDGKDGSGGKSAYDLAVENGFTGSVTEWLATLGGENGKSAYQIAVENGFQGSEKEWLLSLAFGENGKDGQNGKDGENGKNGKDGEDGTDGKDGVGIRSVFINEAGHLIVILDNGDRLDAGAVGGNASSAETNDFTRAQADGYAGTVYDWLLTYLEGQHTEAGITQTVTDAHRDRSTGRLSVSLSDGRVLDIGKVSADGFLSDTLTEGFRPCFESVRVRSGQLRLRTQVGVFEGDNIARIATEKEYLICTGKRADEGTDGEEYYRFRVLSGGSYVDCYAKAKYFVAKYATDEESSGMNLPDSLTLTAGKGMRLVREEIIPWAMPGVRLQFSGNGLTVQADAENAVYTLLAAKVGTYTLRVELRDETGTLRETKSLPVRVIAEKTVTGVKGLLIGDSRIAPGEGVSASLPKSLAEKIGGVTWLGSVTNPDGIACEAHGGWTAKDFTQKKNGENPFWNPSTDAFDFAYYLNDLGDRPDFVILNLGLNDEYSADSVAALETMVNSIRSTGTKVLLLTEYVRVPGDGGYEVSLLSRLSFTYFGKLRDAFAGRESDGVYLVPNFLSVDLTDDRADAAHLSAAGYAHEADVIVTYLTDLFGT